MERKKASDFPQELLNLLDKYVHGRIDRRAFLDGAQKFAVGGVSAQALFEMLKPNYAWAIQVPKDDRRIRLRPSQCRRRRAPAASRANWRGPRTRPEKCQPFWWCTRTADSIPISKTWRAGLPCRAIWRSRPMGSPRSAAIRATMKRADRCSPRWTTPRCGRISSPRRTG